MIIDKRKMMKPLINPVTEKETKITFRTKDTLSNEISLYVDYLNDCNGNESVEKDDVISELCRYVLDKDKGFKDWKKTVEKKDQAREEIKENESKHKIKITEKEKADSNSEPVEKSA